MFRNIKKPTVGQLGYALVFVLMAVPFVFELFAPLKYEAGLVIFLFAFLVLVFTTLIRLYGVGRGGPGYRLYKERKCLSIKDFCKKTVFLKFGEYQISVRTLYGQLWLKDISPVGSDGVFIQPWNETHNDVTLNAGTFHVARQKMGYQISWSRDQHWHLPVEN